MIINELLIKGCSVMLFVSSVDSMYKSVTGSLERSGCEIWQNLAQSDNHSTNSMFEEAKKFRIGKSLDQTLVLVLDVGWGDTNVTRRKEFLRGLLILMLTGGS